MTITDNDYLPLLWIYARLQVTDPMKGTKVQTLGANAVASAWTVHGWLIGQ